MATVTVVTCVSCNYCTHDTSQTTCPICGSRLAAQMANEKEMGEE